MGEQYFVRELSSGTGGVLRPVDREPSWESAFTRGCDTRQPTSIYDPNKDLKVQLAESLSLVRDFYAFSPYSPGPQQSINGTDFIKEENSRFSRNFHLAPFVLQAIKSEFIHGRLGLKFAESELCLEGLEYQLSRRVNSLAFHGTPSKLRIIEPRQSQWEDGEQRLYADGRLPTIRASLDTKFPTVRANLFNGREELKDTRFVLSKRVDGNGNAHWFTSEEALAAIEDTHSYVYGVETNVPGDHLPSIYDKSREEYSIYSERQPIVSILVTPNDLPPDLYVIGEADKVALTGFFKWDNPREFSDRTGVSVRPLGGLWPTTDYFPL
jgi:hypothetical protein